MPTEISVKVEKPQNEFIQYHYHYIEHKLRQIADYLSAPMIDWKVEEVK